MATIRPEEGIQMLFVILCCQEITNSYGRQQMALAQKALCIKSFMFFEMHAYQNVIILQMI